MSSPATNRPRASSPPPRLMRVALEASYAGHAVFPLWPRSKKPALRDWESAATCEDDQIRDWWSSVPYNVGIATGPSGLHVVDLDDGHGHEPPPEWPRARGGRDVLARLAEAAGQPYPGDTYTVATPTGGLHLYFRAPEEPELRSTVARLGWRVDTRGAGGYIVAAGSVRPEGYYRAMNRAEIAPLPLWLVEALTPPPPPDPIELDLPAGRASAYVAAVVEGETDAVALATTGSRRNTLLRAAGRLGRLVGGGELDEHTARSALRAAAQRHIGHDGFTEREADTTIRDGMAWGIDRPRHVTGPTR
ncbi:bifunctional DNA primase/polymerase [Saccharopolyspora taberi]|uniref:Bifunctional DNA primase/polymerase n=1 Tax=Saccharopolyspora taberi TaxID=60895 RepID=A0ABN3VF37_9PSEU